jgi:hypothetical protein
MIVNLVCLIIIFINLIDVLILVIVIAVVVSLLAFARIFPLILFLISETNVEQIFVKFSIGAFCYVVGGVYIPSHSNPDIYKSHVKSVESITCQFKDHIYSFWGTITYLKYYGIMMIVVYVTLFHRPP